jgi:hypothetical protein
LKFGVMVESISLTWYPARNSGVATARMPSGAVASVLANDGKKKTTLFFGLIVDARDNTATKNRVCHGVVTAMSFVVRVVSRLCFCARVQCRQ